jgi:hypothetical protein
LSAAEFGSLAPLHGEPLWLIDRIADLLDVRAQRTPVLIGIDDYQWAGPLTRFALRALAGRVAGLPVLWLLASRGDPEELSAELSAAAVEPAGLGRLRRNQGGDVGDDPGLGGGIQPGRGQGERGGSRPGVHRRRGSRPHHDARVRHPAAPGRGSRTRSRR